MIEFYFISYNWWSPEKKWFPGNKIIDMHPTLWLDKERKANPKNAYYLVFYKKINAHVALKVKDVIV